ncbi:MAG: hypothetical protein K2X97_09155, partial [Mycobacteriaceae bacterium]|nr:hypothetical protein [Mycobacteriaceae bacterium]
MTPNLLGLDGGAEAYGVLTLNASQVFASAVLGSLKPADASALVARIDVGPADWGADFDGFDLVLFANLSTSPLDNAQLGVGDRLISLVKGGWANDPLYGGSGDQTLSQLGVGQVYAMLVPEDATEFQMAGAVGDSPQAVRRGAVRDGEVMYLTTALVQSIVDQRTPANDVATLGADWEQLGQVTVGDDGTIQIDVANGGLGSLSTDAIRLERAAFSSLVTLDVRSNPLNSLGQSSILAGLSSSRPGGLPPVATVLSTPSAPVTSSPAPSDLGVQILQPSSTAYESNQSQLRLKVAATVASSSRNETGSGNSVNVQYLFQPTDLIGAISDVNLVGIFGGVRQGGVVQLYSPLGTLVTLGLAGETDLSGTVFGLNDEADLYSGRVTAAARRGTLAEAFWRFDGEAANGSWLLVVQTTDALKSQLPSSLSLNVRTTTSVISDNPGITAQIEGDELVVRAQPGFVGTGRLTLSNEERLTEARAAQHGRSITQTLDILVGAVTVSGRRYDDTDGDNVYEPGAGEPVRAGEVLYVDLDNDSTRDPSEPYTVTNAAGQYRFSSLPAGLLTVRSSSGDLVGTFNAVGGT